MQIILKDWAVSQRNGRLCLKSGTIKRTKQNHRIAPHDPTKKFGGNVESAATSGGHLQTADFAGAAVRSVQKNSAVPLLSIHNMRESGIEALSFTDLDLRRLDYQTCGEVVKAFKK